MTVDFKAMEAKKVQPQVSAVAAPSAFSLKKIASYFADIKAEFYKITWTNREELRVYTWVVVAATFLLGFGVYAIDLTIQSVLALLDIIVRFLFG